MKIAVVSAVFGGYDIPVFVEQTVNCQYVMVSDGVCLIPDGWNFHLVQSHLHPRLSGKFPKCRPWDFVDSDFYVWIDGSVLPQPNLVAQMLADLGDGDIAFHPHPDRTTITSEAKKSAQLKKYPEWMNVVGQARSYVDAGHPDDFGLWAAGLFVMRNSMAVRQMGQMWLDEILRWGHQDQLPLPVVLRRCGLDIRSLTGGLRDNGLFVLRQHADHS